MEHPTTTAGTDLDPAAVKSVTLRLRHSQALSRLMAQRDDLRGVHALADLVDDSVRWGV